MRVYRALALNAEVITGVARRPLDVISTSTQKNINYHNTYINSTQLIHIYTTPYFKQAKA